MKKLLAFILIASLISLFFQCTQDDIFNEVNIRIENQSAFDFDSVRVASPGGNFLYRNIGKNQTSEYKKFDYSYSYAFIQVYIDGKIGVLQPIDYVGEKTIPNGNYSFQIKVEDFQNANNEPFNIIFNLNRD